MTQVYADPQPVETYSQVQRQLRIAREALEEIAENQVGFQSVEAMQRIADRALKQINAEKP